MYILGINAYHGDSSACLLKDGKVICATEEERFRRIKHWAGFPSEAIKFCLQDASISIEQVNFITISRDSKSNFFKKVIYSLAHSFSFSVIWDRLINLKRVRSIRSDLSDIFGLPVSSIKAKIYNIEHHRSHIASSFFASRFKESAILSIDGFGDFTSTMTAVGKGNKFKVLNEINYPHSLGIFYTAITQFLGFFNYGDEYKVMGLASYGEPVFLKELEDMISLSNDGLFTLNKQYFKHFSQGIVMEWDNGIPSIDCLFTEAWIDLLGKPRDKSDKIEQWHRDLAASAQRLTENVIFYLLNHLHAKTGLDNICITGGVAQNSVANGKIIENTPFKNIYIPSAGNDAGTSIGSALYLYNQILGKERLKEIRAAYFGNKASNEEII